MLLILLYYFGLPLYAVIEFIISMIQLKKTNKADTELLESRKKKAALFGILSVIFIGGMVAVPIFLSSLFSYM